MEKIVYFLGAGFSEPLGLPLMSNFLIKSRDMYFNDSNKYKHFEKIFKTINKMSTIKNYFNADLFNIEEILSILEMQDYLGKSNRAEIFKKYIADVIEYYTPEIKKHKEELPSNWEDFIFGNNSYWNIYGHFITSIFNSHLAIDEKRNFVFSKIDNPEFAYSVITLNYDLILEKLLWFIKNNYKFENEIGFSYDGSPSNLLYSNLFYISKLHGSIDSIDIIPPTWNKGNSNKLIPAWRLAKQLLKEANHIRILGYSLPTSDIYIQYLLKSAILESQHLKSIDVICLDNDDNIKKRYDNFINFNFYRFRNKNIIKYIKYITMENKNYIDRINQKYRNKKSDIVHYNFNCLEKAHRIFIETN